MDTFVRDCSKTGRSWANRGRLSSCPWDDMLTGRSCHLSGSLMRGRLEGGSYRGSFYSRRASPDNFFAGAFCAAAGPDRRFAGPTSYGNIARMRLGCAKRAILCRRRLPVLVPRGASEIGDPPGIVDSLTETSLLGPGSGDIIECEIYWGVCRPAPGGAVHR